MNTAMNTTARPISRPTGPDWWRGAVGYEIYIRSFLDSNGDGVGDLAGITAKLDYLVTLGIDVIWITPFYPSPGKDHGYDVANYIDVDPQFGTLSDFDMLITAAHERDLRVFIDIVPNHTSSEHPWFRSAASDLHSPYRKYYLFRPPAPDGGPPNNWVSHFGGPAWSPDPAGSGDYYCHLFLPEQPDLDWSNPLVMDEFMAILRFWCARGIDGFRIDVAHGLAKDPLLSNNLQLRPVTEGMHPTDVFESFDHLHDLHREETIGIYRRWREEVAPFGVVLLGEMDSSNISRFGEYVGARDGLDGGFVLRTSSMTWDAESIIADLLRFDLAANGGAAWALSNHDQPRVVTRFGGGARGVDRALAVMTLMVALDGITFLYQGEELGLPNAVVIGHDEDPISTRNHGAAGRDVTRGPVPWQPGDHNGFTSADAAWLQTEPLPATLTVGAQLDDPSSTWHRYQTMVALRKRLPQLWSEQMVIVARTDCSLILRRGDLTIVANLGTTAHAVTLAASVEVEHESSEGAATITNGELTVAAESTVIVRTIGTISEAAKA